MEIHEVYEYVSDMGPKYTSTTWMITEKLKDNNE